MKKEISLLETAGDFTVNDMSYLSVWIQAVIFLVLLHYWRRQDAAVHKKDRIYAGVVCSVLITAILLLCYQLCGTGLGFWNFRDCPMEYGFCCICFFIRGKDWVEMCGNQCCFCCSSGGVLQTFSVCDGKASAGLPGSGLSGSGWSYCRNYRQKQKKRTEEIPICCQSESYWEIV